MRISLACALLGLGPAAIWPQAPATPAPPAAPTTSAAPPTAQVQRDDIGFSFSLPSDWEFVAMPAAPKPVIPYPALVTATKGDACVEVALTARHGDPASVVVVMVLPFLCYGQTMTASDLENFGEGASQGMKQTFDLSGPMLTTYSLGSHTMWIERATGAPKDHAERPFTFEIACTVLEKGAACWLTMAVDATNLHAFEQAKVSFDGEPAVALVPANVFLPEKP
jgi:hypothetical protein